MLELSAPFLISAFIAGVLMFLAPCTLPLVPAFLAFISGVKPHETGSIVNTDVKRLLVVNAAFFIVGFSLVFISFGILAGFFGSYIGPFRSILTQIGGVLIILFGLIMLGIIRIEFLEREHKLKLPTFITPGNPLSSAVVGAIFALGWTPCVGPVLASVLLLATTSDTVLAGALLLVVFSIGFGVPFLLVALCYGKFSAYIAAYSALTRWVGWIGGVFLIFLGLLLLTQNFGLMVSYGYTLFEYLNFDILFKFL